MLHQINFPTRFLPGTTDNFVSNEVIVANRDLATVWHYLVDTSEWEKYYDNATNIHLADQTSPELHFAERFHFDTFGFPIEAQVMELEAPTGGVARIAWHGWNNDEAANAIDVYHAFLLEELPGKRVRLLTQESQLGPAAKQLATQRPNPMLNGHQAWLDGLTAISATD